MAMIKIEVDEESITNDKVVDKLKEIVDKVESKIDCTGGYSLKIGYVYIDNHLCDLFMLFGYSSYFYALDSKTYISKSTDINSKYTVGLLLEDLKFSLKQYDKLYDDIEKKIKSIVRSYNDDISNKKKFYDKLIEKE